MYCSVVTGGVDIAIAKIQDAFEANQALFKQMLHSQSVQGQTKGLEAIKQLLLRLEFSEHDPAHETPLH